jgi:hypothetical protein
VANNAIRRQLFSRRLSESKHGKTGKGNSPFPFHYRNKSRFPLTGRKFFRGGVVFALVATGFGLSGSVRCCFRLATPTFFAFSLRFRIQNFNLFSKYIEALITITYSFFSALLTQTYT